VGAGPGSGRAGSGSRCSPAATTSTSIDVENNGRYSVQDPGNEHSLYAVGGASDVVLRRCLLHDVNGVQLLTRGARGFTIEYTKLARNGPVGFDGGHREAWSASDDDDMTIRYCILADISNTAFIGLVNGEGDADDWVFHGNVFVHDPALDDVGVAALFSVRYADPHFITARRWVFHHNTIVGVQGLGAGFDIAAAEDMQVANNLWYGNTVNSIGFPDGVTHDHDWFGDNWRTDGCDPPCDLDPDLVAGELNAELGAGDPFVDWEGGDFRLAGPTAPGAALDAPYDVDMFGTARGADGNVDRGAIERPGP
jgi:hypothetical protein